MLGNNAKCVSYIEIDVIRQNHHNNETDFSVSIDIRRVISECISMTVKSVG